MKEINHDSMFSLSSFVNLGILQGFIVLAAVIFGFYFSLTPDVVSCRRSCESSVDGARPAQLTSCYVRDMRI